jgi:hypothetical protein
MPGLAPDEVARLLGERAERLRLQLRAIEATHAAMAEAGLPRLFAVESELRAHTLEAELDYVTRLAEEIGTEALPGTAVWRRIHELRAGGTSFEEIISDPVRHLGEEGRILQQ